MFSCVFKFGDYVSDSAASGPAVRGRLNSATMIDGSSANGTANRKKRRWVEVTVSSARREEPNWLVSSTIGPSDKRIFTDTYSELLPKALEAFNTGA